MRYLQFNNISIDTHNQLLVRDGESIALAPKVYDLLVFFCKNSQRVISKDELMEQVWTGTLVTENAISRTLVKVRKALGDDPKNPQFILTVPRKGYRMVADFEQVEEAIQSATSTNNQESVPSRNTTNALTAITASINDNRYLLNRKMFVIVLIVMSLIAVIYVFNQKQEQPLKTKQLMPLTREVADEQHPSMSPDLAYIAYTKIAPAKRNYINIENLTDHTKVSISHPRAKLSRPVWSPTENKLAFLYQHNSVCTIYWADIEIIKDKASWQKISDCSVGSWPHFVFSSDGKQLYFNDRQSTTNGYQIFRVNLANLQREIVNQPITSGQGNYSFDISPDGERLVMLNSEFAPKTRIYTLDIEQAKLAQTAQLPYLMRSVTWHHDSQTLIHPSPHPAYELWQSNLAGEKLAVVASNTSRVKQISRINNGKDFSFVSYLLNRDIYFQALNYDGEKESLAQPLDNSSVMDYLPALANHSDQYAFVSKRTTTAEVYLAQLPVNGEQKPSKRLTFFNNPVKLFQLAFSPDDSQLMILADNQIFIADIANDNVTQLALENIAIAGVSWRDQNSLLLSTVTNNDWQLMQFNLDNDELEKLPSGFQGGIYSPDDKQYYLIADETGQVVKTSDLNLPQQSWQATTLHCVPSIINRQLNLKTTADGVVCQSPNGNSAESDNHLMQLSPLKHELTNWHNLATNFDYQTNKAGVIYTKMTQSVADIMQTSTK